MKKIPTPILAGENHKDGLVSIWRECFGAGEKNFAEEFLRDYFIPEYSAPVIIEDGRIVSALHLLEFDFYSSGEKIGFGTYMFACSTAENRRDMGYMTCLIKYAADLSRGRGSTALFNFPCDGSAAEFYRNNR